MLDTPNKRGHMTYTLFCTTYASMINAEASKTLSCMVTPEQIATWQETQAAYELTIAMQNIAS